VSEKKGSGVPPENGLGGAKKNYRIPARISGSGVTLAAQAKPSILPPKKALAHGLEGISVIGLRLLLTACPQGTCDRGQTGSIATAGLPC